MKELIQAGNFYRSLDEAEQEDLIEAIASDIYFLDEGLQQQVIALFERIDRELAEKIEERNSFTR